MPLGLLVVVAVALAPFAAARADAAPPAATGSAGAEISDPLPDLPEVPSSRFGKPTKEQLAELEELLGRARHPDALIRDRAIREILEVRPSWVDAIYHRLNQLADDADRDAMSVLLSKIRGEARNVVRQKMRAEGKTGHVETPDYLTMVADYAKPNDDAWKNLMTLLTMSRMLVTIGNVWAARALIHTYVRFGEFIRVDTQLQLEKMGDRALAALIEARRHPAEKIGKWAERQLDLLGKAIPSETVRTDDPEVLADVLRAHGRIRDPDAARIVISFANSEKAQIRLAARQGVALLGEVGNWQLRDTYENIVGKKPRRDWSWKRTARELFAEFDRLRLARVHQLFDKGLAALKKREFEAACKAFDGVLAQNPMFDRRDEMVDAYVAYAKQLPKAKVEAALLAARRAERTNQDAKREHVLESLRLTLQAERELERGVAEQVLFRRALELDSSNQRAREALAMIERGESEPKRDLSRYYAALAIAGGAVLAILLIALWRPKERSPTPPAPHPEPNDATTEEPPASATEAAPEAMPGGEAEAAPEAMPSGEAEAAPEAMPSGEAEAAPEVTPSGEAEAAPEAMPSGEAEATLEPTPPSKSGATAPPQPTPEETAAEPTRATESETGRGLPQAREAEATPEPAHESETLATSEDETAPAGGEAPDAEKVETPSSTE